MSYEVFVSEMMSIGAYGRMCHWATPSAQHHTTFETFLTQNEELTDSFVESIMGNEIEFKAEKLKMTSSLDGAYNIDSAKNKIKSYRAAIKEMQELIGAKKIAAEGELVSILDDLVELCSKTLYLLKLS